MRAELLRRFLLARPERVLLAAVSGSHAYGFPSADSDVDLKAVHLAPTGDVVGLGEVRETAEHLGVVDGLELDYTSHELGKAGRMLLRGNGNLLEWVLSELVVLEHPRAPELRALARRTLHRGYARHYAGFSRALLEEHQRERRAGGPGRAKPLLYALRTALTGVQLLRAGECQPSLPRLLELCPGYEAAAELIALKRARGEAATLEGSDEPWLQLVARAQAALEAAREASALPEEPPDAAALSAWVAEVRLSEG